MTVDEFRACTEVPALVYREVEVVRVEDRVPLVDWVKSAVKEIVGRLDMGCIGRLVDPVPDPSHPIPVSVTSPMIIVCKELAMVKFQLKTS